MPDTEAAEGTAAADASTDAAATTAASADATEASTSSGSHNFGPKVHMSSHPVLNHKITKLRSSTTKTGTFRALIREVTYHLGYEATSTSLTTKPTPVTVPIPKKGMNDFLDCKTGHKLKERVAMIPIMRSGLGMIDGMLELLPNSAIHHIGMYRSKGHTPVQYFNRLPRVCEADVAYVLDPLIATAATLISVVRILEKWGVPKIHVICVIASASGLKQLLASSPNVSVTVGVVDDEVDDEGNIVPGLGDIGDRLFNISHEEGGDNDDEALVHPSKRKRSYSHG